MKTSLTIPLKWLLPAILLVILSPIFSVIASVKIAENNSKKQQQAQLTAEEKARQAAKIITCRLFTAILDTYEETPPITPAGKNQQKTWLELHRLSSCQPPR